MSLKDYGILCEQEPKYTSDEEKIIIKFRDQFQKIKSKGFIESHRTHNTGIGKTFEDLMNIKENNIQDADYKNLIEIKTKRIDSESMITLFTKSPDYPPNSNSYLREKYGVIDKTYNMKTLHTTVSAIKYNTFKEDIGFKLECSDEDRKLYILIHDSITGKILERRIFYTYETLEKIVSAKCANIAYVNAENRINNNGLEEFRYTSAKLLTGCTFEKFISAVKDGTITYDIRIGFYKSGKSFGKTHDHGSGFRIKKSDISAIFTVTEL
ncbi:MAG TPA: MvaI/BcnI family restriction endonuclease [Methanocorpusculum sp.]|nr:MvaI/BcnI family restriction endonuclease [Methanocorpusculum sp.]